MGSAAELFEDPKAIGAVIGATVLVITVIVAHAKALYVCCRHRRPRQKVTRLQETSFPASPDGSKSVPKSRSRTPSVNIEDESAPLISGSTRRMENQGDSNVVPGADAYGVLAGLFLVWNLPLVYEGWKTPVQRSRIPPPRQKFQSTKVSDCINRAWEKQKVMK